MKIDAKSTHIKITSAFLATALIAVPCLNQSLQAKNLLKNGDAEAGDILGWTKFIGVAPTAHAGGHSFVLAGAKDSSGTAQSKEFIPVDPSSGYTVSGYFFMSPEGTGRVHLDVDNSLAYSDLTNPNLSQKII